MASTFLARSSSACFSAASSDTFAGWPTCVSTRRIVTARGFGALNLAAAAPNADGPFAGETSSFFGECSSAAFTEAWTRASMASPSVASKTGAWSSASASRSRSVAAAANSAFMRARCCSISCSNDSSMAATFDDMASVVISSV